VIWHIKHDEIISRGAWVNVALYVVPGILLLLVVSLMSEAQDYITPVMIIYLVGALAHMIGFGFQAVCVQLKVCADYQVSRCSKGQGDE
jgi:hypothetical protein